MVEPTLSACHDPTLLAQYAAGSLPAARAAEIAGHLGGCDACRRVLQDLKEDDALAGWLRSAAGLDQEVLLRRRLEAETAGQYEVLAAAGRGAGGVVFKARDLKLNRLVAIKCLNAPDRQDLLAAALQEARHLATINHPNVAAVYGISEGPDVPYIVMEYVDGVPITQALAGRPVAEQVGAFADVLRAVAELHRRGIVHRDLKPGNVLVDTGRNVKLLDFGIAQHVDWGPTATPEGTPAYLAPEQARGGSPHPSSDVFSLGVILFELLTGQRPFAGQTEGQLVAAVRASDPPLPRELREEVPGALQAICLTALEKEPGRRYASAREFLLDVGRYTRGEAVWANPTLLATVLEHGIERHVQDIRRWQKDRAISARECDYFLDRYGLLRQREESWVLDSRRMSFSQVMLHLGAWSCAVSAFLMLAFPWPRLGTLRPVLPASLLVLLLVTGLVLWRRRTHRVAIVLLMGAAMTAPIAAGTAMACFGWLPGGRAEDDLVPGIIANRQLLAALAAGLAVGLVLWWHTRTAAFAMICACGLVAASTAAFGLIGLRHRLADGHFDTVAGWYLGVGAILFLVAIAWDLPWKVPSFATPFYVLALVLMLGAMTLIAEFGPTLRWLGLVRVDEPGALARQVDYSFMINGAAYLLAGLLADRSVSSPWLRWIGKLLFWLAPSHLLIPILRLENDWPIAGTTWTFTELALPAVALAFVFFSVPRQMKPFFFSGLFYVAVSVQRLTARHFENEFAWPITLAVAGLAMVLAAWRWPGLFDVERRRPLSSVI